jgi:CBS domain-containing protein
VDVELLEIRDFLAEHPPFNRLCEKACAELLPRFAVRYLRRGRPFPPEDESREVMYVVRQGAVTLRDEDRQLLEKLGEGDFFLNPCQFGPDAMPIGEATEDTLLYLLPCATLQEMRARFPEVDRFFRDTATERLKQALQNISADNGGASSLLSSSVGELLQKQPVVVDAAISVQQAAATMTESQVSSLVVMQRGQLAGLLTDSDIRKRVVARGLPLTTPVVEVMTSGVRHVNSDLGVFDALLLMTDHHVHHLPVIDDGVLRGVITTTDLVRHESANAVYLTGTIRKASSLAELIEVSQRLPELQLKLVISGATAKHVGQAMVAMTDAITCRLLELAEEELGAPPVPYAWVAGGSQARYEQTSHSDQDNALIIGDELRSDDGVYFAELARRVTDGLNACGYVYCPGNSMASNPQWRQPLRVWSGYFDKWIHTPEPMALMLASIFFDLRTVYGEGRLLEQLRAETLSQTRGNGIFLAYMTSNALKHRPPLGFFRDFVLVHDEEHDNTLDLKHNGVAPIVDLARVYALAEGVAAINTSSRLQEAAGSPSLSTEGAANLVDAYELIATLRIRHQVEQIRRGRKADNFLPPKRLSRLERDHLKDAFKVIAGMQETLGQRYQAGRFV